MELPPDDLVVLYEHGEYKILYKNQMASFKSMDEALAYADRLRFPEEVDNGEANQ